MRYFTIRNGLLLVGLQCLGFACATVPDEAPQEFHTAASALERADERDVDDYMPTTLDKAEIQLEEAMALWKKSKDTDVKKEERADLLKSATDKANAANAMTEQAIKLQDQVKAWDNNIESYTQMQQERQDAIAQLKLLQDQNKDLAIASATAQNQPQQQQQPTTTASPDVTLRGPVAYFSAGSTDVDPRYEANINSLAKTLTADTTAKVTLSGFADPRGNKELNDRLARERAEAVASILRDKGVSSDQIVVKAWPGSTGKGKAARSQGQLQLDRRVEAYISTAANQGQQGQPAQ
ncbi:MAG TPA: OmpA family protein [Oligoflexus sp.]|uniref:OmpA family protein n=1 Tax=Oligoflexus sp. TaxID=1971216 RepID=UPI002D525241|nr:OmpA family protein [Oligoflexus sp.]HYX31791.1 OmpA family protein [Oligoflexus sp.]